MFRFIRVPFGGLFTFGIAAIQLHWVSDVHIKREVGVVCALVGFRYNDGMADKRKGQLDALKAAAERLRRREQLDLLARKALEHDKKFEGIDTRFDAVDKRFDGIDKRFDEHDEQFTELKKLGRNILSLQDQTLASLRKTEVEQTTTTSWLKRLDKDVERLKKKVGLKSIV